MYRSAGFLAYWLLAAGCGAQQEPAGSAAAARARSQPGAPPAAGAPAGEAPAAGAAAGEAPARGPVLWRQRLATAPVGMAIRIDRDGRAAELYFTSCGAGPERPAPGQCRAPAVHRLVLAGDASRVPPAGPAEWVRGLRAPAGLRADETSVWVADGDRIVRLDVTSGAVLTAWQIDGAEALSDVELGFDGTVFAADAAGGRIFAVRDGVAEILAEGARLGRPAALHLHGGRLYIGSVGGQAAQVGALSYIDLASRAVEPVPVPLGQVSGLARDHRGLLLALDAADARLLRVSPEGEMRRLEPARPGAALAFEPRGRVLLVAGGSPLELTAHRYPLLIDEPAEAQRLMGPLWRGGMVLEGAEYWPYRGKRQPVYPEDVLWGFYPARGIAFDGEVAATAPSPAAVACAETAFRALGRLLAAPPAQLAEAVRRGASNRFYLWVNDYSQASTPFPGGRRPSRLWYWERKPPVMGRVPGFWKWEVTLTQRGECQVPRHEQIAGYLTTWLHDRGAAASH
jgi:hypothetical protein